MRTSHRWVRVAGVVALLVALATSAAARAQDAAEVVVQGIDTSAYPTVTFTATVPPTVTGGDGEVEFAVEENGRRVGNVVVEHLQGETAPPDVVLLIDTSGSMRGAPIADAKAAAAAFTDALGSETRIALVSFDDQVRVLSPFGQLRSELLAQIDGLEASGETALYDALSEAAALLPASGEGQRAIVVLSDGGDTVSARSFETAVQNISEAAVPVYAVALQSDEYNPQALTTITQTSSGRLIAVGQSVELAGSFEAIAEEISDAYLVTYTSNRPQTKDVEIDVTATSSSGTAAVAAVYPNPRYAWEPGEDAGDASVRVLAADGRLLAGTAALAFGSVALLVFGALALFFRERTRLNDLRYYDQLHSQATAPGGSPAGQVRDMVVEAVAQVAGKRGLTQAIALKLEQAGLPLRAAEYMTAHIFAVVVLGAVTQVLLDNFVLSAGVVIAASFAPILALDVTAMRRRENFEVQLPDILSMMASSLRGGWGLLQAIEFVVTQAGPPAAAEFRRAQTEARLGMPLEEALRNMGRRIGSPDLDAAVTAIIIQREVGGNLAEVLDIVAKTVRDRAALARQVRALTAEGRLSAYILIALPFVEAFALAVASPGYLAPLLTTIPGLAMLIGALVLLVTGALWLRAITQIEV